MGVTVLRPPLCVRLEGCCEFPQKVGRNGKIKTLVARAELNTCMFTPSLQKSILCSYNLSRKPVLALWAGMGKITFENKPTWRWCALRIQRYTEQNIVLCHISTFWQQTSWHHTWNEDFSYSVAFSKFHKTKDWIGGNLTNDITGSRNMGN